MNTQKGRILVSAEMDKMGNIYARPVCTRYAKRFAKVVQEFTGHFDLDCFFQDGMGSAEFLEYHVPKRHKADLQKGWPVRFLADPWEVGHWYGYDAHNVA